MRVLHVKIEEGDEWLVAQGLEEPGIITQGRTFDELIANVRDAAQLFLEESDIHIELLLPAGVRTKGKPRGSRKKSTASRKKVA
jgi:predicted RNase H-like HicB family nuclease